MTNTLTRWEWRGLANTFNLADGHAHQEPTQREELILDRLGDLFRDAQTRSQVEAQDDFLQEFFGLAGQLAIQELPTPLFHYSSSQSIEVIANYLRLQNYHVTLLTPTFDNIPAILQRHQIPLQPLRESQLLRKITTEPSPNRPTPLALFLVLPNNPTGWNISEKSFAHLLEHCKSNGTLLILDTSFRFFSSNMKNWDQYKALQRSGIDFIVIEDTGKTWSAADLKVGLLVASASTYAILRDITDDMLLNVSQFSLDLLRAFIRADSPQGKPDAVRSVERNRSVLEQQLRDTALEVLPSQCPLSVAWLRLPALWRSTDFCEFGQTKGVSILPGEPFFWDQSSRGRSYVRAALLRPTDYFERGAERLAQVALEFADARELEGKIDPSDGD